MILRFSVSFHVFGIFARLRYFFMFSVFFHYLGIFSLSWYFFMFSLSFRGFGIFHAFGIVSSFRYFTLPRFVTTKLALSSYIHRSSIRSNQSQCFLPYVRICSSRLFVLLSYQTSQGFFHRSIFKKIRRSKVHLENE